MPSEQSWSQQEVEATVTDYFAMLDLELRKLPYNKTEHRRHLAGLLDSRSDGAIERKRCQDRVTDKERRVMRTRLLWCVDAL